MKPKCAWIDHCSELNTLFAILLRQRGIQLDVGDTIEDFSKRFDLNNYPVLLYHPGIKDQGKIKKIIEKYPIIKVALITAPCSGFDYKEIKSDIPIYTYDPDSVEQFIRENQ